MNSKRRFFKKRRTFEVAGIGRKGKKENEIDYYFKKMIYLYNQSFVTIAREVVYDL